MYTRLTVNAISTCWLVAVVVMLVFTVAIAQDLPVRTGCRKVLDQQIYNNSNCTAGNICDTGTCRYYNYPEECSFPGDDCQVIICFSTDGVFMKIYEKLMPDYNTPPEIQPGETVLLTGYYKGIGATEAYASVCGDNGDDDCLLERVECDIQGWLMEIKQELCSMAGHYYHYTATCPELSEGWPI